MLAPEQDDLREAARACDAVPSRAESPACVRSRKTLSRANDPDSGAHARDRTGGEVAWRGEASTRQLRRRFDDLVAHFFRADVHPDGAILATGTCLVPESPFTLPMHAELDYLHAAERLDGPAGSRPNSAFGVQSGKTGGRCECSLITVEPAPTTGPIPVVAESARRISPVSTRRPRNDSLIASIGFAHRTQMTGSSSVVTAVLDE